VGCVKGDSNLGGSAQGRLLGRRHLLEFDRIDAEVARSSVIEDALQMKQSMPGGAERLQSGAFYRGLANQTALHGFQYASRRAM
jgi:hypothetical protein